MDVKEDKTVHNVVFHNIKTKYFRCPACNYADIRLPRFQKHLETHNCLKVSQGLVQYCLKIKQEMVTAFIECSMPQCDFRTNTDDNLNDHLLFTHNIYRGQLYGWGIGEAEPYTPVRKMPPSLHDIAKSRFCVKMIGKFYGATQAVAVFHQVVSPKTYTVTRFDSVMGLFKFTLHPSLKTYCKQKHYANDNENLPRARMEVMDVTKNLGKRFCAFPRKPFSNQLDTSFPMWMTPAKRSVSPTSVWRLYHTSTKLQGVTTARTCVVEN